MDMMILGETIGYQAETTVTYTGFWMPSGGDDATGAIDVIVLLGGGGGGGSPFTVKLQTKNSEDADSAASDIGSASISGTGVTKFDASSAKELVRYVIVGTGEEEDAYMHFQFMQPQWVPN